MNHVDKIRTKLPNHDWQIGAMMMIMLGFIALYIGYSDPDLSAVAYSIGITGIAIPILVYIFDRISNPHIKSEEKKK